MSPPVLIRVPLTSRTPGASRLVQKERLPRARLLPKKERAEGVADSGAGSAQGTAGTLSGTATTAAEERRRPLLADEELDGFRGRWDAVQVGFVDEPRGSVQQADALVAELMQRLAQTFSEERTSLESQWEQGADVSTEDLRVAMQRYRSFFDRLLRA